VRAECGVARTTWQQLVDSALPAVVGLGGKVGEHAPTECGPGDAGR
jgi:hypothetical protein